MLYCFDGFNSPSSSALFQHVVRRFGRCTSGHAWALWRVVIASPDHLVCLIGRKCGQIPEIVNKKGLKIRTSSNMSVNYFFNYDKADMRIHNHD